jgi:hypothetical protein
MNRTFTAIALSTLFLAAPAFARHKNVSSPPVAGDTAKAPAGETKPAEGAKSDTAATGESKTKKHSKSKKSETKTEGTAPAEPAPAK